MLQPWASLAVTEHPHASVERPRGIKAWETRSWRPGKENHKILMQQGLLIHASKSLESIKLMNVFPFSAYRNELGPLETSAIIGWVSMRRVLPTANFRRDYQKDATHEYAGGEIDISEEMSFGDFAAGRYAWEWGAPIKFKNPIRAGGFVGLWDFPHPIDIYNQ